MIPLVPSAEKHRIRPGMLISLLMLPTHSTMKLHQVTVMMMTVPSRNPKPNQSFGVPHSLQSWATPDPLARRTSHPFGFNGSNSERSSSAPGSNGIGVNYANVTLLPLMKALITQHS